MREITRDGVRYVIRNGQEIEVQEIPPKFASRRRRSTADDFAMVPLEWATRATKATKTPAALVYIYLQYRAWKAKGKSFTLASNWLKERGVSRKVKMRVLRDLEANGLIAINRAKRTAPRITVL